MNALSAWSVLQLFGGLVLLIAGAQLLVRCAEHIASKLKVRPLLVGLTVVAMGSSAPQMTVSLQAALNDTADIAVGSVIGSNIFNILVTLGLSALIIPLRVSRQLVRLDIPLMILASIMVFALALNHQLDRLDGALLLVGLLVYLFLLLHQSRHSGHHHPGRDTPHASWLRTLTQMGCALLLLGFAGHLLLGAAVAAAAALPVLPGAHAAGAAAARRGGRHRAGGWKRQQRQCHHCGR